MKLFSFLNPENYPEYFFREIYKRYPDAFLVAEVEGKIIGYIMCRMEGGISNFGLRWVRKGHIVSVAVLPEYRRLGLGSELIDQSFQAMAKEYKAKEVILEVRVNNTPAVALYDKLEYKRIRTMKSYYRNGEDALLMAKKTR